MFDSLFAKLWNRFGPHQNQSFSGSANLGYTIVDGQQTGIRVGIPERTRLEHMSILGKTGSGKSTLMKYLVRQDIEHGRGFCFVDLHGDATAEILALIAAHERTTGRDFSTRLIVLDPADPERSVGLNLLDAANTQQLYVQIAEFTQILKDRWNLDRLGPRTEELMRNALIVLAESKLTLLELPLLLVDASVRSACVKRSCQAEVRDFFRTRYDRASDGMQAIVRDAILNKISAFSSDPHFRHMVGQVVSSFSFPALMDAGKWLIVNLDKGRLGEQAGTLGALLITKLKNAVFARKSRRLFTLYCDELPNLLGFAGGLETLFSEARKFGVSVCSANQFSDQYGSETRAAIAAIGTHLFFRLSAPDAEQAANSVDGGRALATTLKNLPRQEMIAKIADRPFVRVRVPTMKCPYIDFRELFSRSRTLWARGRDAIEAEIAERAARLRATTPEVLNGWE